MAAVPAPDRPEFLKKHGIEQIAKVPASKENDVREAIEAHKTEDPGRPFSVDAGEASS